jgi:hypothetical protein
MPPSLPGCCRPSFRACRWRCLSNICRLRR